MTRALLNRVAELIARGEDFAPDLAVAVKNDPSRFYSPIFESLERLDQRAKSIAMILLSHIAQRVTTEFPWLATGVAINSPDIQRLADERERLGALKNLEKEGALEIDKIAGRVRIRVPLTADAIRAHAIVIRQEAIIDLRS